MVIATVPVASVVPAATWPEIVAVPMFPWVTGGELRLLNVGVALPMVKVRATLAAAL